MFPDLKTSFLPKVPGNQPGMNTKVLPGAVAQTVRPVSSTQKNQTGLLTGIGFLILISSVLSAGGIFMYNRLLASSQQSLIAEISEIEKKIDVDTLQEINSFNARVDVAGQILDHHRIVSHFFEVLNIRTLKTIRFDSFSFEYNPVSATGAGQIGNTEITMSGAAKSYTAIAQQSESFSLDPLLKQHVFSGFQMNDKNGTVEFMLTIDVPSSLVFAGTESKVADQTPQNTEIPITVDTVGTDPLITETPQ